MDITTFMIVVYCLIEDYLVGQRLRARGPQPTVRDSEVLTKEVVGEFLGIDTESNIFTHFRRYYSDWFPRLGQITGTTCTRQAANLCKVKQELWQVVAQSIPQDPFSSIVDSFPVPVCRFARAPRCRSFGGVAALGHDEVARQTYYGLRAHVRLAGQVSLSIVLSPLRIFMIPKAQKKCCKARLAMSWQTAITGNLNFRSA